MGPYARLAAPALLVALASLAAPQSVHVVDDTGGSGGHFTSLQAAIDASSPGDVLILRTGLYDVPPGAAWFDVDHTLTITADAGAQPRLMRRLIYDVGTGSDWLALRGTLLRAEPIAVWALGNMPASGELQIQLTLGELGPGVETIVSHAQAAFFDEVEGWTLGPATTSVYLDASF